MVRHDCLRTGAAVLPPAPSNLHRDAAVATLTRLRRLAATIAAAINTWRQRARGRRELREMTDRQLMDVALTRADVIRESEKAFWER